MVGGTLFVQVVLSYRREIAEYEPVLASKKISSIGPTSNSCLDFRLDFPQ